MCLVEQSQLCLLLQAFFRLHLLHGDNGDANIMLLPGIILLLLHTLRWGQMLLALPIQFFTY